MGWRTAAMFGACGLAACGGGDGDAPDLVVTTAFAITEVTGLGPSPLDPLDGQVIDLAITLDAPLIFHETSAGCRQTIVHAADPPRVAAGASAALVQAEVLARLPDWYVVLDLCDDAAQSRIVVDAVIDPLNLQLGCLAIPAAANVRDANGDPVLTTFTGASCSATILDVVNNRALGASGFTIQFATGPDRLP